MFGAAVMHALEVWQNDRHVKHAQGHDRLGIPICGIDCRKAELLMAMPYIAWVWSRGVTDIKVYIIIIMGHLVLSVFYELFDNFIEIFRKKAFNF